MSDDVYSYIHMLQLRNFLAVVDYSTSESRGPPAFSPSLTVVYTNECLACIPATAIGVATTIVMLTAPLLVCVFGPGDVGAVCSMASL